MKKAHDACENSRYFLAIDELIEYVKVGEWQQTKFLLKGSRSIKLERLFPILEKS